MLSREAIYWSTHVSLTPGQFKQQAYACDVSQIDNETMIQTKAWLEKKEVSWIHSQDLSYPQRLSHFGSFSPVLYRKWDLWLLNYPVLWIVGSRIPTSYQKRITEDMCQELSSYLVSVISGGAQGIDMIAHTLCLQYGIPTIVVLWAWFRRYEHRSERSFFERVVAAGWCILSPWKIDQWPTAYTFPQRNKLIAWASQALFVPWAAVWSWTCITIDFAIDFGIPVYSAPWPLYDASCVATNTYLAERKVSFCLDYKKFLGNFFVNKKTWISEALIWLSDEEESVLLAIDAGNHDIDILCLETGIQIESLLPILSSLEINQRVVAQQWWWYKK